MDKKKPPLELVQKVDEINTWLTTPLHVVVEPYWAESSEFGDEWKLRIVATKTDRTLINGLCAATADGHTYYMFVTAMEKEWNTGHTVGMQEAAGKMYMDMCKNLGVKSGTISFG